MDEGSEIRRKRLRYSSRRRGTKELDLILGRFVERHLAGLSTAELDRYEALLGCDDGDIYAWVVGRASPPPGLADDILSLIRSANTNF